MFALAALLGYELGRSLAGERAGLWSGILIAANGAFAWGATSGMEVALFSVLILGTLLAFLRELSLGRFLLTPILAALAALTRPEGLLFALIIAGAVVSKLLKGSGRDRPVRRAVPGRRCCMRYFRSLQGWPSTYSTGLLPEAVSRTGFWPSPSFMNRSSTPPSFWTRFLRISRS